MAEAFLILLAGGIMLAAAVSNPKEVTLHWLRLCGIIALVVVGLSMFFLLRRSDAVPRAALWGSVVTIAAVLGQLAFVQIAGRRAQRLLACGAFLSAIFVGVVYLRAGDAADVWRAWIFPLASAIGIAGMTGLALMDMLLGHAYLTASTMTMRPFRRLNLLLGGMIVWRTLVAVGAVLIVLKMQPIYMFWGLYGLYILTRWLVGLAVPAAFVYMAHDCIKRRATQSATGILYVAGVLIFIGEIMATYLVRMTGLPF
jgi:hypothetical protein